MREKTEKLINAIGISLFESQKFGGEKVIRGGISPTLRANKTNCGVIEVTMADVEVVGSLEAKFESTNRIYGVGGVSPTLSTMQGGNQEPKILEVKQVGFMDSGTGKHQSNTVYDEKGISPSVTTITGGGTQQIKVLTEIRCGLCSHFGNEECNFNGCDKYDGDATIVAMRGRNPNAPSDRAKGSPTKQRSEINTHGVSNCLTSVQKDNLCLEKSYRIRKLTPLECFRLMGVTDVDAHKMLSVNSKTQCYKQAGNSIVVDVMCAMFRNLNIQQT